MPEEYEVVDDNLVHLFYSYAHADELLRSELNKHLILLQRQGLISPWHDRNIDAGTEWRDQISTHLNAAHIILLLISPDFMASDYCYTIEMQCALERHDAGEARVIPILLRPVDLEGTTLKRLQALPREFGPITTWANRDLAFEKIAIDIRKVVGELKVNKLATQRKIVASQKFREEISSGKPLSMRIIGVLQQLVERLSHGSMSTHSTHIGSAFLKSDVGDLRRSQKKVSELKSIHNMLHEIELPLGILNATIHSKIQDKKTEYEASDFNQIGMLWRLVMLKFNDLKNFAAELKETLEDKRLSFVNDRIQGPWWITELFALQTKFEANMQEQNMKAMENSSRELLDQCRSDLYHIDKELLKAVNKLDVVFDRIWHGSNELDSS